MPKSVAVHCTVLRNTLIGFLIGGSLEYMVEQDNFLPLFILLQNPYSWLHKRIKVNWGYPCALYSTYLSGLFFDLILCYHAYL